MQDPRERAQPSGNGVSAGHMGSANGEFFQAGRWWFSQGYRRRIVVGVPVLASHGDGDGGGGGSPSPFPTSRTMEGAFWNPCPCQSGKTYKVYKGHLKYYSKILRAQAALALTALASRARAGWGSNIHSSPTTTTCSLK